MVKVIKIEVSSNCRIEDLRAEDAVHRETIDKLHSQINDLENELAILRRRVSKFDEERAKDKKEMDRLRNEIQRLRKASFSGTHDFFWLRLRSGTDWRQLLSMIQFSVSSDLNFQNYVRFSLFSCRISMPKLWRTSTRRTRHKV